MAEDYSVRPFKTRRVVIEPGLNSCHSRENIIASLGEERSQNCKAAYSFQRLTRPRHGSLG